MISADERGSIDTWSQVFDETEHLSVVEMLDKIAERTMQVRTLELTLATLKARNLDGILGEVAYEVRKMSEKERFDLLVARTIRIKDVQAEIAEYVSRALAL